MGIVEPMAIYVNKVITDFLKTEKPEWSASDKVKRAARYSNSYNANVKFLVGSNFHCKKAQAVVKDE